MTNTAISSTAISRLAKYSEDAAERRTKAEKELCTVVAGFDSGMAASPVHVERLARDLARAQAALELVDFATMWDDGINLKFAISQAIVVARGSHEPRLGDVRASEAKRFIRQFAQAAYGGEISGSIVEDSALEALLGMTT